jgi:hypothetical protein
MKFLQVKISNGSLLSVIDNKVYTLAMSYTKGVHPDVALFGSGGTAVR